MTGASGGDLVVCGTDRLALTVSPAFGARVLGLTDRTTGRQWLQQGATVTDTSDAPEYCGAASRGWDECFPTVLQCHHAAWGGRLRDHGMLWGRPWEVVGAGPQQIETRFRAHGIDFARRLTLEGPGLVAAYSVTSTRDVAAPYLWSQHCVLDQTPDDRIAVSGFGPMQANDVSFDWPAHPARDLSQVGRSDEGFALKCYAMTPGAASASVSGSDGGLRFDWDGADIPALGLWLNYGGWPDGDPVCHVALEPTTGAADDLVAAELVGQARRLDPGDTHGWSVRLTLTDPQAGHIS